MTWLPGSLHDNTALHALQPNAYQSLMDFLAVADQVNDRALLSLCKLRIAQNLKCRALLQHADPQLLDALSNWSHSSRFNDGERAVLDFTDQFMVAAKNISDEQIAALAQALDVPEPSTFVYAMYINEGYARLLAFFDIDAGTASATAVPASVGEKSDRDNIEWVEGKKARTNPRLLAAYYAYNLATCSLHGVDEVTDEIVRLRSAEYHDCKFCQSVRRIVDLPAGTHDLMNEVRQSHTSAVLTEQQKVALAALETFVIEPAAVSADLKKKILQQFTPAQIVELMMKEVFWMSNKPMISLGTDPGAVSATALTPFEYDAKGNFVLLKQRA
jgi:alkylhydroperoxidase family enzyme